MRERAKYVIEDLCVHTGVVRLAQALNAGRSLVLAYHNVVPDDDAHTQSHPLHLARSDFVAQLDALQEMAEVVPLEEIGKANRSARRPRVALTFDDAYAGAVELAGTELRRRGLPATFFVCPGFVNKELFWWDAYSPVGREQELYHELLGDTPSIAARFGALGIAPGDVSVWRRPASLDQLKRLIQRSSEARIGSHSWSHRNLSRLPEHELREELSASRHWVREHFRDPSDWLACPYGFNSPSVQAVAEDTGYAGVLEIAGDWVPASGWNRWRTPRVSVPNGVSSNGFRIRVAGIRRR